MGYIGVMYWSDRVILGVYRLELPKVRGFFFGAHRLGIINGNSHLGLRFRVTDLIYGFGLGLVYP